MPCSDRTVNQHRATRLYQAKSTAPSLLRAIDMNTFSPSRRAAGPKDIPGPETHQTKPYHAPVSTGSSGNLSSNDSVGTVSTEVLSVTSPKDSPDGYFPFDVKTKIVLPVMPRNVTHAFALTAVGQWLDNFQGIVKKRSANNVLAEYCMKIHTGDEPDLMLCPDGMHIQSKVRFNSGSSKFQTTGIGYYFQFCKHKITNSVDHYRILTYPLSADNIAADAWLSATLDFRRSLAPRKRGPRIPKIKKPQILSPEALPPVLEMPAPPHLDITPTVLLSPRSSVSTGSPAKVHAPHKNASPPSVPSDASRSSSVEDTDLLGFTISEYLDEVKRHRRAGLPSPRTSQDVDIPIRFYLPEAMFDTELRVNKYGRVCLKKDEELLVYFGFPLIHMESVWMLVPYTETDPIWQKVSWDEEISVGGALSITFMVEKEDK